MKRIKLALILLLLIPSATWLLADTLWPTPFTYFSFRGVFVQYSGVVGIALMSVAMILATRPRWLEPHLNGLDKMYRLHKWLGIGALCVTLLHWWFAKGTKWMVGWGWLSRPERRQSGGSQQALPVIEQWFRNQRGLAESIGEWAFYIAAALILLALIKAFPYRWFKKTHNWLAVTYLALAWHSLILMKYPYWAQPVGWLMAALLFAGSVSAILVLTRQVGRSRQAHGHIKELTLYPGVDVIEARIALDEHWAGHAPGQFAFVTSRAGEGAHPYTIASAWNPAQPEISFVVKSLGDWTSQLKEWLKVGMQVTVEGPYGCFDFADPAPRQIWVGAGIGVTPFIARMKHLAQQGGEHDVDFFHVTRDYDQAAIDQLTADAAAAGIRLHLQVSPRDGRLTPEQIRHAAPHWRQASLWYCGPADFGQRLRDDFAQHGVAPKHMHQELFEMR
ncbi:MAG: ferric reductase-like transmembrane domain-containing protein [Pseudomonadaceae bacterium]